MLPGSVAREQPERVAGIRNQAAQQRDRPDRITGGLGRCALPHRLFRDPLSEGEGVVEHRGHQPAEHRYRQCRRITPARGAFARAFARLARACRDRDAQHHDCDAAQNQRSASGADDIPILHEQRNQRAEQRPESDDDGVAECHTQSRDGEAEQYLRDSPSGAEREGRGKYRRRQRGVHRAQMVHQRERQRPRQNNQRHRAEDQPRVLPRPALGEFHRQHAVAGEQSRTHRQ